MTWVAAAVAFVVLAGAGIAVALNGGDDDPGADPDTTGSPTSSPSPTPELQTLSTRQIVAAPQARVPEASARVAMAGRLAGVRVSAYGEVDQVGTGDDARVAEEGAHLVGFTLAKGPCQDQPCRSWKSLELRVAVDGRAIKLPQGGPTFVVAADDDAEVELVYEEAGFDQRVSLLTGDATGQNIAVLLRSDRQTDIGMTKVIQVTANADIESLDREVTVKSARLYFFEAGLDAHPKRPGRAYLYIEASYTRAGSSVCTTASPCLFAEGVVTFEANGTAYDARDINDDPDVTRLVFDVPADLTRGTLVYEGSISSTGTLGTVFTQTLERTTFPVDFRR